MTQGARPTEEQAEKYGYRLLSLRSLSVREFRAKLKGKGYDSATVEAVALHFQERGYLHDGTVARQMARSLAVNKLWGDYRIERNLKEKGFAPELIAEALLLARQELTEKEAVLRLLAKKGKGAGKVPADRREKSRLLQSLMRKGFPSGLIFEILAISGEEEEHDGE